MQSKIWFIKIENQKEGPFSIWELKCDSRVTPDTLVWKDGFKDWIPARKVPELKSLFEDEEPPEDLKDRFKMKNLSTEDSILAIERSNFPFFFYWMLVLFIVIAYLLLKFQEQ